MADFYYFHGRFSEAEEAYVSAIDKMKSLPDEYCSQLLWASGKLSQIYTSAELYSEAEEVLKSAIDSVEGNGPRDYNEYLPDIYGGLSEIYMLQKKWLESEKALTRYIELLQKEDPEAHLKHSIAYQYFGRLYLNKGKLVDAETAIMKGLDILARYFGETHREFPKFYCILAYIYYSEERFFEAEEVYALAIKGINPLPEQFYADIIVLSVNIGKKYKSKGKYSESEELLKTAKDLVVKNPTGSREFIDTVYSELTEIYLQQRKPDDAQTVIIEEISFLIQHFGETHEKLPDIYCRLAWIYYIKGRKSEAKAIYVRFINEMKSLRYEYCAHSFILFEIYQKEGENSEAERVLISVINTAQVLEESPQNSGSGVSKIGRVILHVRKA